MCLCASGKYQDKWLGYAIKLGAKHAHAPAPPVDKTREPLECALWPICSSARVSIAEAHAVLTQSWRASGSQLWAVFVRLVIGRGRQAQCAREIRLKGSIGAATLQRCWALMFNFYLVNNAHTLSTVTTDRPSWAESDWDRRQAQIRHFSRKFSAETIAQLESGLESCVQSLCLLATKAEASPGATKSSLCVRCITTRFNNNAKISNIENTKQAAPPWHD